MTETYVHELSDRVATSISKLRTNPPKAGNAVPDHGIVLKRQGRFFGYDVWLPSFMQPHLPYLPHQLPVIPREISVKRNAVFVVSRLKPVRIEHMWSREAGVPE